MKDHLLVFKNTYHDSAFLMRISRDLKALPAVAEAVVLMATPMNRELLLAAGFEDSQLSQTTPMDMVVALRLEREEALESASARLERSLAGESVAAAKAPVAFHDLDEAIRGRPAAQLVSVAVPGAYAAFVAHQALQRGRHVFLFSNNVALEDEIALKKRAVESGLLLMGPDCGTAILGGVGFGFANRVDRGPIGLVGASGTGLQEICCRLADYGLGVSQAIGTGSRDLSAEVGGAMTRFGLELLRQDKETRVVVLVAKHPAAAVTDAIHPLLAKLGKPVVVRYLGKKPPPSQDGVLYAATLDEAACQAAALASGQRQGESDPGCLVADDAEALLRDQLRLEGRLVGLFGGGSLMAEARFLLGIRGIAALTPEEPLDVNKPMPGLDHLLVDTGEDFYTRGRPHPMVDQTVRCALLRAAGADPGVGLILLDLVLGDGAHLDPAPELAQAIAAAQAARGGKPLLVVGSVSGTRNDPQDPNRQRRLLASAGVHLQPSAARAAALAAALLTGKTDRRRP